MPSRKRSTFEISESASKDFLREADGWNLDLSAMPSIAKTTDSSFDGHSMAPLVNDGSVRSVEFKRWLRKSQNGDTEVRRVLDRAVADGQLPRDEERERAAKTYIIRGENVRVEPQRDGTWLARHRGKTFIGKDRESTAVLASRDDYVSEPTAQDKLRIARYVSGVHAATSPARAEEILFTAIKMFIEAASGPDDPETLAGIRFLPLVNAATKFCWESVRSDFSPGPDWTDFVNRFANGRQFSVSMLDAARRAYESALEASHWTGVIERKALEQPPEPADMENLSDEAVEQLYRGVFREAARQARRPRLTAS